jgi:DNA repair photolyase
MKLLDNPPNPYDSTHHEWLEPPPAVQVQVFEETARSILSENDSPDVGFRWSVNPYRGCQHACIYCYARPTHEYLGFGAGSDFETRLVVKTNAPELLDAAFRKPGWNGDLVAFSGVTDCYQPLEAVWSLTRRCLEVCVAFRNPASVVTKSYLVCRDVDVLQELGRVASSGVMFSIPFLDAKIAKMIEPGAPPPERRFEAMRRLADAGVHVGVMVAPIIPGLNDNSVAQVLARAADCGATSAGYVALRLPGSVEPVFLSRLRDVMPLRCEKIENRIREIRGGRLYDPRFKHRMRGEGTYWESVKQLWDVAVRRYGLDRPFRDPAEPTFRVPNSTAPNAQLMLQFA